MLTLHELAKTDHDFQDNCHGCFKFLSEIGMFPAQSRYGHGDLCAECGLREAFEGDFIQARLLDHLALCEKRGQSRQLLTFRGLMQHHCLSFSVDSVVFLHRLLPRESAEVGALCNRTPQVLQLLC